MQKIAIRYDNELSEHLDAARLYYAGTRLARVDKIVAVLLVGFGAFLVHAAGVQWWTLIWFPLAVLEWFNVLSLQPLQIRYTYRTNPKFRETYEVEFSDSGIRFKTENIDSTIAWDHYSQLLENERVFLLVYGRHMYSVIPKRAFSSQGDMAEFREMVGRHIGG